MLSDKVCSDWGHGRTDGRQDVHHPWKLNPTPYLLVGLLTGTLNLALRGVPVYSTAVMQTGRTALVVRRLSADSRDATRRV